METRTTELQKVILERMGFDRPIQSSTAKPHALLVKILEVDPDVIELALGKFGVKLRSFAQAIDLEHPHVSQLFEEIMPEPGTLENLFELLQLAELGKANNLTKIISALGSKVICREKFCRNLLRAIDNPANNRWRIRLLKTRAERDQVRSQKHMQIIDLSSFFKKGDEIWVSQPNTFHNFIRYNTSYQEEISVAERKAQRYLGLGCKGLSDNIQEAINSFKSQVHESYFDFNRVTMTNAAIVLAKFLGCRLVTSFGSPSEGESKSFRVSMPRTIFGDYNFEITDDVYIIWSGVTGSNFAPRHNSDSYEYEPRVYPLDKLWHLASDEIKRLIDHLEVFPEANGKAIFDNYVVLVPGPFYPRNATEGQFTIRDANGIHLVYNTREAALFSLDSIMLKNNVIPSVLLGERDGKCFFISFWK